MGLTFTQQRHLTTFHKRLDTLISRQIRNRQGIPNSKRRHGGTSPSHRGTPIGSEWRERSGCVRRCLVIQQSGIMFQIEKYIPMNTVHLRREQKAVCVPMTRKGLRVVVRSGTFTEEKNTLTELKTENHAHTVPALGWS